MVDSLVRQLSPRLLFQQSSKLGNREIAERQGVPHGLDRSAHDAETGIGRLTGCARAITTSPSTTIYYDFPLPNGSYTAELIDPWEMTTTPLSGTFTGKSRIKLSGRPYQALRFRRT
jgi:hypothetical protein